MAAKLEHVNMTVSDPKATAAWLAKAPHSRSSSGVKGRTRVSKSYSDRSGPASSSRALINCMTASTLPSGVMTGVVNIERV